MSVTKRGLDTQPDISELETQSDSSFTNPRRKKVGLRPRFYDQSIEEHGEPTFSTKPANHPRHHQAVQHRDTNLNEPTSHPPYEGEIEECEPEVRAKPSQHEVRGQYEVQDQQHRRYGSMHSPSYVSSGRKNGSHSKAASPPQHLSGAKLPQPIGDSSATSITSKSPTLLVLESDPPSRASNIIAQNQHDSQDGLVNVANNLSQNRRRGSSRVHFQDQPQQQKDPQDNRLQQNMPENDRPGNNPRNPLLNNPNAPAPQGLNWRKFIYYSLCLPESEESRWCTCRCITALFLHLLIFAQGIAFILISVISIADDDSNSNNHLVPAKTISCLVGIFFILIFLYWLLVSSCTFARGCQNPLRDYNFYFLSLIWFLLVVFGIGLFFAMLIQTIDEGENIHFYFTCQRNDSSQAHDTNYPEHCLNSIIVWALAAITFYFLYCSAVFCLIVIKTILEFCRG